MAWIEKQATRFFADLIERNPCLEAEIRDGEKDRISDGFIYIYRDSRNIQTDHSLQNGNFIGRVLVQVKGRKDQHGHPFPLTRTNLENIEKAGGLLFLVADIPRDDGENLKGYYADLAPRNVKHLLGQMKPEQKNKSVPLTPFPNDPTEILSLVSHIQKRLSLTNVVMPNQRLFNEAEGLTIASSKAIDFTYPQLLGGPNSSAIISVKGPEGTEQVIDSILQVIPQDYGLERNDGLTVSCGSVQFDDTRKRKISGGRVQFYISPGISLVLDRKHQFRFTFRYQSKLHDVRKDLAFIEALLRGNFVSFDGVDTLKLESDPEPLRRITSTRPFLDDLDRICSHFEVDPRIFTVVDLSPSTYPALKTVVDHITGRRKFDSNSTHPLRQTIEIGGRNLELIWWKNGSEWDVHGLFDPSHSLIAGSNTDKRDSSNFEPVTPYEFFSATQIANTLNLNRKFLLGAYRRIGGDRGLDLASGTVFKLLSAADQTLDRRSEFLDMAEELNDWILSENPDDMVVWLNGMQIRRRRGTLTNDDLARINEVWCQAERKDYGEDSILIELAANVLLRRADGVSYLLSQIDDELRERLEKSPLMFLHRLEDRPYEISVVSNVDDWQRIEQDIEREMLTEVEKYRMGRSTWFQQS